MEQWILLVHVLAGATWFGGHVYTEALMASAARTGDPDTIMRIGVRAALTNGRLFGAAGIVTLVTGVWLVLVSVYEFETLFVAIGLLLTVVGLGIGFFLLKPKEAVLASMAEERGPTDPEVMAMAKRLGGFGHAMTAIVTIIIVLMVLKPGV